MNSCKKLCGVYLIISFIVLILLSVRANGNNEKCTLFIAPSTIPGAGLGAFTSIPRETDSLIEAGDITIPLYDLCESEVQQFVDYVWNGTELGMSPDSELCYNVDAYSPGLGSAINAHNAINNVKRTDHSFDTTLPHRSQYPTAGSMTPYWNASTFAMRYIPANSELFKDYGESWFIARTDFIGLVPLRQHYHTSSSIMRKMETIFANHFQGKESLKRDLFQVATSFESRLGNAFPEFDEMEQAVEVGIIQTLQSKHMHHNLQTMPEARCLENIVSGDSSLEGAGRGGFARHNFKKGQVITGSPIIHIPDKSHLDIYHPQQLSKRIDKSGVFGKQLILNYCWSHPRTSMLLCPYGAGVNLINHSQEKANVLIRWPPNGQLGHHDSSFEKSVHEMSLSIEPRLAFDYVALKDIGEGEELFLDYGDDWVKAWRLHVAKWNPDNRSDYKAAAEWNEILKDSIIRTDDEQKREPYPPNVELVCRERIQKPFYEYDESVVWGLITGDIQCNVTQHKTNIKNASYYTVEIGTLKRKEVKRSWIRFKDKKKSTDIHLVRAFRHASTLPNRMLPAAWQNLPSIDIL